jgi:heat shock protein HslJ
VPSSIRLSPTTVITRHGPAGGSPSCGTTPTDAIRSAATTPQEPLPAAHPPLVAPDPAREDRCGARGGRRVRTADGDSMTGGAAYDCDVGQPPLVGTEWQLVSYQDPGEISPVAVQADSILSFSAAGRFIAHACNRIGGTAQIDAETIVFGQSASTRMGCVGEPAVLDLKVTATLRGPAAWSIRDSLLTVTAADGRVLVYRVRPSIYPSLTARTILAGDRAGGHFRLAVEGQPDRPFLIFEEHTATGERWGSSGIASPGPDDRLASHVMEAGHLGGETFVVTWATPRVGKVTIRPTDAAAETHLTFHPVPESPLRIAGAWIADLSPGDSRITFYDHTGNVLDEYPSGPS